MIHHEIHNNSKTGQSILISDKTDIKILLELKNKTSYNDKSSTHQKDIRMINTYAFNNTAAKYT